MNNKLYGNLIFELSHPGRRAYSLPENSFGNHHVNGKRMRNFLNVTNSQLLGIIQIIVEITSELIMVFILLVHVP